MSEIYHALVLNLHQPSGNLDELLNTEPWAVKEILFALDRMPRALWAYEDVGRAHLTMSGTLLESLSNPEFQQQVYGIVDCGSLLWWLQNKRLFELLGTGYYHPVLPLTPEADWDEQIGRWQGLSRHLFWRQQFAGFWPPEMGFCMELIPHLARAGYRYVLVDSEYVDPVGDMSWQEVRYRPHVARHDDAEIVIVVRDRDLSNAQLAGMEYGWFANELTERTKWCDFPPLVTTATDGDNGGWFRNVHSQANFWTYFYHTLLDAVRAGKTPIRPTFIDDYLDRFGAHGEVTVRRGAWNTDEHHGWDFKQWTGSQIQRDGLERVSDVSANLHAARGKAMAAGSHDGGLWRLLDEAQWRVLRAETSCNFYWGEAWVGRAHQDLDVAADCLHQAETVVGGESVKH